MRSNTTSVEASNERTSVSMVLVIFTLFLANLLTQYPGVTNWDSNEQYAQAVSGQFNDWHPPIMARLWSVLRLVAEGSGPLFAVHVCFYWLGFGLIAVALSRTGRNRAAWAVVAVGAFPPFLVMNIQILKDVGMAVSFLLAYSICFFYRSRARAIPIIATITAVTLLLYGILVRVNGIFAAAPLLIYLLAPAFFFRPAPLITTILALIVITIPAFNLFNHKILGATPYHAGRSLIVFDIAGISYFSNDTSVFWPGSSATSQSVSECYTPVEWDTLAHRDGCRFWDGPSQLRRWVFGIIKHPLAYAEHRLAHFNSELVFVVPRHYTDARVLKVYVPPDNNELTTREKIMDYLSFDRLVTPMFTLVMGIIVLVLSLPDSAAKASHLQVAAFCLALSGVMYTLGYLFVGVASQSRYHYWSMLAIFIAAVMCVSEQHRRLLPPSRTGWVCIAILAITQTAILVAHSLCGDALSQAS